MSEKIETKNGKVKICSHEIPNCPIKEKFLSYISVNQYTGCWLWTGAVTGSIGANNGRYGGFTFAAENGRKAFRAHRLSYSIFIGNLTPGLVIDHLCKNTLCVNPDHLREVSQMVNVLDGRDSISLRNKNKTHCVRGHALEGENLYMFRNTRVCKTCRNINQRARKKKILEKEEFNRLLRGEVKESVA